MKMESTPIAQFSRWQLAMRYGSDPTYGRDVLSWGDGQRLLWVVRLPGGGFGMEMMPQRLRVVLISGSDWSLDSANCFERCLRLKGSFPVPGYEGLSVTVIPEGICRWCRKKVRFPPGLCSGNSGRIEALEYALSDLLIGPFT